MQIYRLLNARLLSWRNCVAFRTRARLIGIESAHQTPLVPADAGTQALQQKLGSRIRGNERVMLPYKTLML
jgi:hypothetical protein